MALAFFALLAGRCGAIERLEDAVQRATIPATTLAFVPAQKRWHGDQLQMDWRFSTQMTAAAYAEWVTPRLAQLGFTVNSSDPMLKAVRRAPGDVYGLEIRLRDDAGATHVSASLVAYPW